MWQLTGELMTFETLFNTLNFLILNNYCLYCIVIFYSGRQNPAILKKKRKKFLFIKINLPRFLTFYARQPCSVTNEVIKRHALAFSLCFNSLRIWNNFFLNITENKYSVWHVIWHLLLLRLLYVVTTFSSTVSCFYIILHLCSETFHLLMTGFIVPGISIFNEHVWWKKLTQIFGSVLERHGITCFTIWSPSKLHIHRYGLFDILLSIRWCFEYNCKLVVNVIQAEFSSALPWHSLGSFLVKANLDVLCQKDIKIFLNGVTLATSKLPQNIFLVLKEGYFKNSGLFDNHHNYWDFFPKRTYLC